MKIAHFRIPFRQSGKVDIIEKMCQILIRGIHKYHFSTGTVRHRNATVEGTPLRIGKEAVLKTRRTWQRISEEIAQRNIHSRNHRVIPIKLDTQRTKHFRITFADCQPDTVNDSGALLRQQHTAVSRHNSTEGTPFCTFISLSCRTFATSRIFKTCPSRFMPFRHFPYLSMNSNCKRQ